MLDEMMDKDWMSANRMSNEYDDGVNSFLHFALENARDPNLSCPCAQCGNTKKADLAIIKAHLFRYGMDLTYKRWIWHGEGKISLGSTYENSRVGNDGHREDLIDMVRDAYDIYEDNPSEFETLLDDAEKPLYVGCQKYSKLATTVKLYNLKATYGWSNTSFNSLLKLLRDILPEHNQLPMSVYEAKKSLLTLGMDYEKIHACPNDCILYRKNYKDLSNCPTCGLSRWKLGTNNKMSILAKVLWYFPPIPRFRRMFRTKEIAKDLTWHADKRCNDGHLCHPADAPAWKLVDIKWPEFGIEPRNLRLALAAYGINPHSLMNTSYSCWPVLLVTYNLSPWLCMKKHFIMLTLLISGPKQPGNDIDVYLSPLIDDLKILWEEGVHAYDAHKDENFTLKSVLLWTINDFPAYGNLSGCSVKGYFACPVCGDQTSARWLRHGKKILYAGHRRFLPRFHPYRRQKKNFDGQQESKDAPKPLSGSAIFF